MRRHRLELIKRAYGEGIAPFLRQTTLIARDALWCQTHLVFRLTADELESHSHPEIKGFTFKRIYAWNDFCEETRTRLLEEKEGAHGEKVWWGELEWFGLGWELWTGYFNGSLAVLSWSRSAHLSKDFFCPIPNNAILIWQTVALPEFRGKRLDSALRQEIMREKALTGARQFYISCRDYNVPSRRSIARIGFKQIGYARINRLTKRRTWHPNEYW